MHDEGRRIERKRMFRAPAFELCCNPYSKAHLCPGLRLGGFCGRESFLCSRSAIIASLFRCCREHGILDVPELESTCLPSSVNRCRRPLPRSAPTPTAGSACQGGSCLRPPGRESIAPGDEFPYSPPRHSNPGLRPVAHNPASVKNRRHILCPPARLLTKPRSAQPCRKQDKSDSSENHVSRSRYSMTQTSGAQGVRRGLLPSGRS